MMHKNVAIFLSVMAAILIGNLIVLFYFHPGQHQRIRNAQKRVVEARKAFHESIQKDEKKTDHLLTEKRKYNQRRQEIQQVLKTLPHRFEIPEYAERLSNLIRKHRLKYENGLQFSPEKSERLGLVRYATAFTAQGNYSDLKRFIAELEGVSELWCIETVRFERSDQQLGKVAINIGLSIYFRGDFNE